MHDTTQNARALRQNMTDAERRLWRDLRRRSLGARFRRQVPIGSYIVDFACLHCKLIIELDGGQHLESPDDRQRDTWLRNRGYRVLRFWNNDVLRNPEGVLTVIAAALPEKS